MLLRTLTQLGSLGFVVLFATHDREISTGSASITAGRLQTHAEYLAADERRGRGLGDRGLEAAEAYIDRVFSEAGLVPPPGSNSRLLELTLFGRNYDPSATRLTLESAGDLHHGRLGQDFRPFDFSALGEIEAEVVFAGYGITAPEHDWNDYAELDVEGKLVLVFRHLPRETGPGGPFARSGGGEHALYAVKAETAARHGARGMLLVTDPLHHGGAEDFRLQAGLALHPDQARVRRGPLPNRHRSFLAVHISKGLARALVEPSGRSLETLQRAVDAGRQPAAITLPPIRARIGVNLLAGAQSIDGHNVVGFLAGSDPELRDEWIVIGAHHDHLGAFTGSGDTIFNGADDNASGTAGVLALAQAFASSAERPRRSLVFATFTAEERGLLGSRALLINEQLPAKNIGFMLNLDMIGRNPERPIDVFGDGFAAGLREAVEAANADLALPLSFAGRGYASNSDHDPFFRRDIPILFFFTGLHSDYHQLSDHADKLDYRRMQDLVRLAYGVVDSLAGADRLPPFLHRLAWLGAEVAAEEGNVRLIATAPGSRASGAGLRAGDLLVGLTTEPATTLPGGRTSLLRRLEAAPAGLPIEVVVERDGERSSARLLRPATGFLGVRIAGLDRESHRLHGLPRHQGILIQEVIEAGPAAAAGLKAGDILLTVEREPVGMANLRDRLDALGAGATVEVTVLRQGAERTALITLAARPAATH